MSDLSQRKLEEKLLHDQLMGLTQSNPKCAFYTSNKKFYSVARSSEAFTKEWLRQRCAGKRVLDYGCGTGWISLFCAEHGAKTVGIDISEVSVRDTTAKAARKGVADQTRFLVMDCETTGLRDSEFDLVGVMGVLHHLDLRSALPEIARVLRPDGEVICVEPLGYNPVFTWYRKMTPHLRTKWEAEHLIKRDALALARESFDHVEVRYFHLATLAAVPFRSRAFFQPLLTALETVDSVILKFPAVRWLAWQIVLTMGGPRKNTSR